MKRKTAKQRTSEFANKAIIKKKYGNVNLTSDQCRKLENFFKDYLSCYTGEISDCIYPTIYNLLTYRPEVEDLFQIFQKLKKIKIGTLDHFVQLYGDIEGSNRYQLRNKSISKNLKFKKSQRVDAFLKKKCVSSILKKEKLSFEQLSELEKLLLSNEYSKFKDNEPIIIDLILNFESNFINRYNIIKNSRRNSIEYYKARYADNFLEKFIENKNKKSLDAKHNFANCKEYWKMRGYSEETANIKANDVQKIRSLKSAKVLCGQSSPRSVEFWIDRGISEIEAMKIVRKIQCRDLDFYISKYGEEIGHYKYQRAIQKRITTWFKRDEETRKKINTSKGRTYEQIVKTYGEDAANSIIESRLVNNPAISKESKIFFQALDNSLHPDLQKHSITGYKSPERWVRINSKLYFLDYINGNCIIEYNGSYWHADPRLFIETDWHSGKKTTIKEIWDYDRKKIDSLKQLGYNVLTIWSQDVQNNFAEQINKCKEFIIEHLSHSN